VSFYGAKRRRRLKCAPLRPKGAFAGERGNQTPGKGAFAGERGNQTPRADEAGLGRGFG